MTQRCAVETYKHGLPAKYKTSLYGCTNFTEAHS